MSLIRDYIMTHKDWKIALQKAPFHLKIQEDEFFYLFKYNQLASDFSLPLVQECRGIIIDKKTFQVAGRGFSKFFNLGEPNAAEIDWGSAIILDKVDGSLLKIWYDKYTASWIVSTNGVINSKNCDIPLASYGIKNFYDLAMRALEDMGVSLGFITQMVPKDFTIVCEVTSPDNKVVINYSDYKLTHLATINNKTGEEIELILGLPKPTVYPLTTLEETIEACKHLNKSISTVTKEGFVVKDKYNHRLKIKNTKYLTVHHLKGEGAFTNKKAYDLIVNGETEEYLAYFPEFKEQINEVEAKISKWKLDIAEEKKWFLEKYKEVTRKEFADLIRNSIDKAFLFKLYSNKDYTIDEYIDSMTKPSIFRRLNI